MTTKAKAAVKNGRGRPRSREVESAVLEATASLLAERGLRDLTIEDIAARAKVGKASIYRRWSSKGTLALEAFVEVFLEQQPPVDTGNLSGDLQAALSRWVLAVADTPTGRTLVSLIAEAQSDPELAIAWRDTVVNRARAQHRVIMARAIERGEIPRDCDVDLLMDVLFGSAYHRLLHRHLPLSDEFVRGVVAITVAGAKANRAIPPGS